MRDDKLILSDKQSLKSVSAATDSTYTVDFGVVKHEVGVGRAVYLNITIGEAVTGGTVTFALKSSDDGSTYVTDFTTGAIAAADLKAGATVLRMALPEKLGKFVKASYTPSAALTAGTVNAWLDIN